jgi:catechol 2,3-dioxygenase-like lactoylglutathione lyase family enzyme
MEAVMDWKLEVVVIPVSDVDKAKRFYTDKLGFNVDVDQQMGENFRIVQLTPPGSACSVSIGTGLEAGLQLVVSDIEAARAELVKRGLEPGNVRHIEDGVWSDGPGGPWNSFLFFKDPDGNNWAVQEKPQDG